MRGDALAIKNSERVGGGKRREDEEEEEEEEGKKTKNKKTRNISKLTFETRRV